MPMFLGSLLGMASKPARFGRGHDPNQVEHDAYTTELCSVHLCVVYVNRLTGVNVYKMSPNSLNKTYG